GCNRSPILNNGNSDSSSLILKQVNFAVINGTKPNDSSNNIGDSTYSQLKINMQCFSVYPDGSNLIQNNIVVSSPTNSFDLVKEKSCKISLQEITIGGTTYSAVNSNMLNLTISPNISASNTNAYAYADANNNKYYIAANADGKQINIQYANSQQDAQNIPVNMVQANPVSVAVAGVPTPVVSNLSLYSTGKINNSSPTLTLYGSASNFTSCKMILSSTLPSPISPDWSNIDSIFKGATIDSKNVFDCNPKNPNASSIHTATQLGLTNYEIPIESHVTLSDDSSILVYTYNSTAYLTKFNAAGQIDSSFGTKGTLTYTLNNSFFDSVKIRQYDSNSFILQISSRNNNGSKTGYYVKYFFNGTIDNTFGNNGIATTISLPSGGNTQLIDFIVLKDHSLANVAYTQSPSNQLFITKSLSNGTLDTSFGNKGIYSENITDEMPSNFIFSPNIAEGTNGSLIYVLNTTNAVRISRVNKSGVLDTNYNSNINNTFVLTGYVNMKLLNILSTADGTLYAVGLAYCNGPQSLVILKIKPDGTFDSTFAKNGIYCDTTSNYSEVGYDSCFDK
ncbi:unnamed protein product, partial [Diamesa hyperborea]